MLFHISIPAKDPESVAKGLAELWRGHAVRFPIYPGGWIAFALDDRNTAIEVVPYGLSLKPWGDHGPDAAARGAPGVHAAIATPLDEAGVEAVATRLGWPAKRCTRAGFDVMEVWIEGVLMIEVLTPEMRRDYAALTVEGLCAALGEPPPRRRAVEPA